MSSTEKLHFKIGIGGTYWEKVPIYSILVNDTVYFTKEVAVPSGESEFVEFDFDVAEGPCVLKIRLENKDWTDTVQSEDKSTILKDMLLDIKSIEIDEINLGDLVGSKSQFIGDDPERPALTNCVNLGWNGTWSLSFESPFYIWLLENM